MMSLWSFEEKQQIWVKWTYSMNVSRVEFGGLLEEPQAGMGVDDILDERDEVLREQERPPSPWSRTWARGHTRAAPVRLVTEVAPATAAGQDVHKLSRLVVMRRAHFSPKIRKCHVREEAGLFAPGGREHNGLPVERVPAVLKL